MNIMTAGVIQGLIGASGYMKTADVAMGVYEIGKNKNDEAVMNRALGYATGSLSSATEFSNEANRALKEAQIEAGKKAKAEREEALEERRREKAAELKAEGQTEGYSSKVDTVEISAEGLASLHAESYAEIDAPVAAAAEKTVSQPKVYSPQGDIIMAASEPSVIVRV
ncbi:hypothetical protein [Paenibacillus durus]|uniref:Uncharacterized protein n=1 Tax=Paenibacillus durus TaxID=44251 RepID=A0A089HKI5_PAEDU|nr:hypothetical protein [Paenibacillus durus]AIQ12441.1 hypothetical protein PDUR_11365 [Paenibacillus durus]